MINLPTCWRSVSGSAVAGLGAAVGAASGGFFAACGRAGSSWPAPTVNPRARATVAAASRAARRRRIAARLRILGGPGLAAVDQLDAVAVRVLHEADAADFRAPAGRERRLLGLDA